VFFVVSFFFQFSSPLPSSSSFLFVSLRFFHAEDASRPQRDLAKSSWYVEFSFQDTSSLDEDAELYTTPLIFEILTKATLIGCRSQMCVLLAVVRACQLSRSLG
jgi:hypothetical protein